MQFTDHSFGGWLPRLAAFYFKRPEPMSISTSADGSLCCPSVHVWSCSLCGPERGCGGAGLCWQAEWEKRSRIHRLQNVALWGRLDRWWTGGGQVRGEIGRRCRVPEKAADGLDTQTGNELHPHPPPQVSYACLRDPIRMRAPGALPALVSRACAELPASRPVCLPRPACRLSGRSPLERPLCPAS